MDMPRMGEQGHAFDMFMTAFGNIPAAALENFVWQGIEAAKKRDKTLYAKTCGIEKKVI